MKICLACAMIILCAPLKVLAENFSWGDIGFQPRVYAGYADYSLETGNFTFEGSDGIIETGRFAIDLAEHDKIQFSGILWGIGATVVTGRFFGDTYYQSTLDEAAYSEFAEQSSNLIDVFGDVNAQHSDWAISLGYMLTGQWSIFAGYKSGKTEWDQTSQKSLPEFNLVQNASLNGKFDQNGPFIGTSYSFLIGDGTLTFKAAYAYLNGEYQDSVLVYALPTQSYRSNLDGNSDAYSIGVNWTQPLKENLGLSFGLNYHRYRFDMSGKTGLEIINNVQTGRITNVPITEELFTLTGSLIYTF